jgi:hypothetical protein
MMYTIPIESLDRLDQYAAEGRIIRRGWTGTDDQGRETACLLAALDPERIDGASKCPSEWMPKWLAHLTPFMDNETSDEAWPLVVTRYRRVLRHIHLLTPEGSDRAMWLTIDAALAIAQPHDTAGVIAPVRALIARQIAGDIPSSDEWASARASARAAARAAAEGAWAAEASARAAWASARAAAWASAWAAAWAAEGAAAWAAKAAGGASAWAAAWDRTSDACMAALEAELGLAND